MSEEKVPEVQDEFVKQTPSLREVDLENASEEETETPLKTPKKKFVMTPARLENLRKGREKRAENVRKKKEIESQLKQEEKTKKAEIKKRVERELLEQQRSELHEVSPSSSESDDDSPVPPPEPAVKSTKKAVHRKTTTTTTSRAVQPSHESVQSPSKHVVMFI